eukprot:Awhi_evm1s1822
MSLLSRPSAQLRPLCSQVFTVFCPSMDQISFQQILQVLQMDEKTYKETNFTMDGNGNDDDDDDEDGDDEEAILADMKAQQKKNKNNSSSDDDDKEESSDESESSSEDDSDDESDLNDEAPNLELRKKLKAALNMDSDTEDDDEE